MLIFSTKTSHNSGNSSNLVLRRNAPNFVMRRSPATVTVVPSFPSDIVRNLCMTNNSPFLPTRRWQNKTGAPSNKRINKAINNKIHEHRIKPTKADNLSNQNFNTGLYYFLEHKSISLVLQSHSPAAFRISRKGPHSSKSLQNFANAPEMP